MKPAALAILFAVIATTCLGQTAPATRPTSPMPKNLERTLQDLITLDATATRAGEFIDSLRKITQTNIVINWNALVEAGVPPDTLITIHVKDVSYEAAVRALMDMLPAQKSGGTNFSVGDNTLEITT